MSATEPARGWRTWLARIAFGASLLALLGTSQPRWYVQATINGPNDGGAPERGSLLINVEASRAPDLSYNNRFGARVDPQWGRGAGSRDEATKTSFLLPPGASIHSLTISGHCSGGCCSNEKCTPPTGSYIRATVDHVSVWTKSTRREQRVVASSGPKREGEKSPRVPHLVFELEAGKHVEVMISTPDGAAKPVQVPNCFPANASVGDDAATRTTLDAGPADAEAPRQRCAHYPFHKPIKDPIEVTYVVEATIWGACPDPKAPCAPPSEPPEPRVFDLRATTDY